MRRFTSYGPVDSDEHYYASRNDLIERAYNELKGHNPRKNGHFITVWAPRQTGKTWIMQQVLSRLQEEKSFDALKLNLENRKDKKETGEIFASIAREIGEKLDKDFAGIENQEQFQGIFKKGVLDRPLILILDEFDALNEEAINCIANAFRNIYISRTDEQDKATEEKNYLLHGVALIGVRSVLGIENVTGSPFNIQRSVQIPNLTFDEVQYMFTWYERESGQKISSRVVRKLYEETAGQPGLTCWFAELLTETFNRRKSNITMKDFEEVYAAAAYSLPNNNILNIISKVKVSPYREEIFNLFQPGNKVTFKFDDEKLNYLYMNGVITDERVGRTGHYVKFSSAFVQKRLFNYFSNDLFDYLGVLQEPFEEKDRIIEGDVVDIRNLLKYYGQYLKKNRDWLLKDAPRRKDMRIYEAVFHFNLYMYLFEFFKMKGGKVYPEFPTGNGKIDLLLDYRERLYGMELKSYTDQSGYQNALEQAARYASRLEIKEIALVFFIDSIDEANRQLYERDHEDSKRGVTVKPVFIETGPHELL